MKKAAPSKSLPYWNRPLDFHEKFLPFRTRKNKKGNTQSIHWSVCARTALAKDREGNLVLEFGPTRFARTQGPITWPTREEERGISLWSLDALSQAESFFFLRLHASPCPWWLLHTFRIPLPHQDSSLPSTGFRSSTTESEHACRNRAHATAHHGWGGEDVRKEKTPTRRNQVSQMTRRRWAELEPLQNSTSRLDLPGQVCERPCTHRAWPR